jgi:hypothetical protein
VVGVLAKMAGNETTLTKALDEARSFSPEEMRTLVSLLTADRQPSRDVAKKRKTQMAAAR